MAKASLTSSARAELRQAVHGLFRARLRGVVQPTPDELRALVTLCTREGLHEEATRLRRWLETP